MEQKPANLLDVVVFLRISDMKAMCLKIAKDCREEGAYPGVSSRLERAATAFDGMLKEIEHGSAQRNLL